VGQAMIAVILDPRILGVVEIIGGIGIADGVCGQFSKSKIIQIATEQYYSSYNSAREFTL